ncbi:MAG TPA: hypothetical protein VLJ37_10700 [bacterium]|nr:hypothetical protein [bacterium]
MNLGVNLPVRSATALFQTILAGAAEAYPALAAHVEGISARNFGERLIRFEAERAALESPGRVDSAFLMTRLAAEQIVYVQGDGSKIPLAQFMRERAEPLSTTVLEVGTPRGLAPRIAYEGRIHAGGEIAELARDFLSRRTITPAAADALAWVARQRAIDLAGRKFVMMGAGAELAPTELLLNAGATVLFLDLSSAEKYVADRALQSGTVVHAPGGANLLTQPREIAATIEAFAAGDPVHIGAFAYVGGHAMEWRLTASMNAVLRSLDPALVGSIGLYISPTAPAEAQREDAVASLGGFADPRFADRKWRGLGVLRKNLHEHEGTFWPRNIVSLQGASYLAAQYVEKRLAAEVFAARGTGDGKGRPVTVSANVAGITRTRSMQIPTFQAGFLGAPSLGLETYDPATTRWLSGLLFLQGVLDPDAVGSATSPFEDENEKVRRLSSLQVHGAVYSHPYAVEGAITRAALIGLGKRPRLIPGFVRSLFKK